MLGLRSVAGMSILKAYVSPWCSTEGSAHAGTGTDPCSKPTRHPAICRKRRPRDDLEQLDPKVPEHVRAEVESADPDLDQDVRDWFAPECDRPRLTLLGPVAVRAHRAPIATRKQFFNEVLAYLALRGWSWLSVMNIDNHMVAPTSTWPTCSRDGSSPAATSEGQRSHRDGPVCRPGGRSTPVKARG